MPESLVSSLAKILFLNRFIAPRNRSLYSFLIILRSLFAFYSILYSINQCPYTVGT